MAGIIPGGEPSLFFIINKIKNKNIRFKEALDTRECGKNYIKKIYHNNK